MNPDATAALLNLQAATTEADAYALITAAILAGLNGNDAQAALDQWHHRRAREVQVIGTRAPRCVCRCGPSVHVGGYGACHLCGRCLRFEDAA